MSNAALACTERVFDEKEHAAPEAWTQLASIFDGLPSGEGSYPEYVTYLRHHGALLRKLFMGLHEHSDRGEGECPPPPSMVEQLILFGVRPSRVELVAQAETLVREANIISDREVNHERFGTAEIRDYVNKGGSAIWQHAFARTALRHAMFRGAAPDSWAIRFAITVALEQAREAYGCLAAAAELQEEFEAA